MPDQSVYDTRLSSNLKKFNSERNLFFTNLYNSDINAKTNSFLKGTLKKCKSYKDFFQKFTDEDYNNKSKIRVQSYNLDETDKNYLFSEKRRNTVQELRKNFENKINSNVVKTTTTKKCEFSAGDLKKSLSCRAKSLDRHSFYLHETTTDQPPPPLRDRKKNKPPVCKKPKGEDLDFYDYSTKSNFILLPKAYTISSRGHEDNLYRDYLQEINSYAYPHRNKRCNSVNGIDLNVLKSELNDFVEPKMRRSRCDYGLKPRTNRFNEKVNFLFKITFIQPIINKLREGKLK